MGVFTLVYQPVMDITTRAIHHYEALTRFADGADTFETVVFSEDVGLIMDFDLSVPAGDQGHGAKRQRQCRDQHVRPVGAE